MSVIRNVFKNSFFTAISDDHEADQVKSTNIVNKDQKIKFDNNSAATIVTVVRFAQTSNLRFFTIFEKKKKILRIKLRFENRRCKVVDYSVRL